VAALKQQGLIEDKMISFYLATGDQMSQFTFGGYPKELIK
jgi:hypothetical protein